MDREDDSFTTPMSTILTRKTESLRSRGDRQREKGIYGYRKSERRIEERLRRAEMTHHKRMQERETDVTKSSIQEDIKSYCMSF